MLSKRNYTIHLNRIECIDEADGAGLAEPYLWTIAIRIGGAEVSQDPNDPFKLKGKPHYDFGIGSHRNIGGDMDDGDVRPIPPSVGHFSGQVSPIELEILGEKIEIPAVLGLIAILMEEDNVSADAAEAGHQALNQLVQDKVNFFIKTLDLLEVYTDAQALINGTSKSFQEGAIEVLKNRFDKVQDELVNKSNSVVKKAIIGNQNILENIWAGVNPDDKVGSKMWIFSTDELHDAGKTKNIEVRLNEGDGDYILSGKFTVSDELIDYTVLPEGVDRLEIMAVSTAFSKNLMVDYITYVGGEHEGQKWILHKHTGAILLRDGIKSFFVRGEDGSETEVLYAKHPQTGSDFMRTSPNDTTEDNLLSLPQLNHFLSEEMEPA